MKIKTSELTGEALDWAVAQCEGEDYSPVTTYNGIGQEFPPTSYSTDWAQGGPIIEREKITVRFWEGEDFVHAYKWNTEGWVEGPTPLIAAMRCYVASKLGDEVEIPKNIV